MAVGHPLEKDTCRDFVLPGLERAGWQGSQIVEQCPVTDGRIVPRAHGVHRGRTHRRERELRADYLLEYEPGFAVAVVEAKRAHKGAGEGLQQGKRYAELLDLPLAYSTNGTIVEHDYDTGMERDLAEFPSPAEMLAKFRAWKGIVDDRVATDLLLPFNRDLRTPSGDVKAPRYYQRAARCDRTGAGSHSGCTPHSFTKVKLFRLQLASTFKLGKGNRVVADSTSLRNRLTALAATQSGYFTASQAKVLGYSYSQHNFHTERGNWIRVERGLFRLPHWPIGLHDDLVRAALWVRGRGVISHESAAVVHALGEIDPLRTHITVPPGFRGQHPGVVLHRGVVDPADVQQHTGFLVTTPLRTLVDLARSATDLDQLGRAIRTALDRRVVTLRELRSRAEALDVRAALHIERALLEDAPA